MQSNRANTVTTVGNVINNSRRRVKISTLRQALEFSNFMVCDEPFNKGKGDHNLTFENMILCPGVSGQSLDENQNCEK